MAVTQLLRFTDVLLFACACGQLTDGGAAGLAQLVATCPLLECVRAQDCSMDASSAEALAQGLQGLLPAPCGGSGAVVKGQEPASLTHLDLCGNPIGGSGLAALASALSGWLSSPSPSLDAEVDSQGVDSQGVDSQGVDKQGGHSQGSASRRPLLTLHLAHTAMVDPLVSLRSLMAPESHSRKRGQGEHVRWLAATSQGHADLSCLQSVQPGLCSLFLPAVSLCVRLSFRGVPFVHVRALCVCVCGRVYVRRGACGYLLTGLLRAGRKRWRLCLLHLRTVQALRCVT